MSSKTPAVAIALAVTSALYLDKPTDVDSYLEVMEQICLQAEPAAKTSQFLTGVLNSF